MIFGQLCRIGDATLKKFGAVEMTTPEKADEGGLVIAEEPAATGLMTPGKLDEGSLVTPTKLGAVGLVTVEQPATTAFGTPEKLDEAGLVTPEGFVTAEQPTETVLVTLAATLEQLVATREQSAPLSL